MELILSLSPFDVVGWLCGFGFCVFMSTERYYFLVNHIFKSYGFCLTERHIKIHHHTVNMSIELQGWSTGRYLEFLDEAQITRPSIYHFDEKWISHPYEGTPVINPDGSICEEYIKRQDEDGRSNLELVNRHFDEEHELYSLEKVIVDERQLDIVDKPTDTMDKLLRVPEVQEVVKYYLEREGGFFVVKPDVHGKELIVKTPEGAEISDDLRESEARLMKAISNVKSYEKIYGLKTDKEGWLYKGWYQYRKEAALIGGAVAYHLLHPQWAEQAGNYFAELVYLSNNGLLTLESFTNELFEKAPEFLPPKEAVVITSAAAALYIAPKAIMSWKRRRGEKMNRDVDESNIPEMLQKM